MAEKPEDTGYWHFQNDIEHSYAGSLVNDEDDFCVTLLGCLEAPAEQFILHGTTITGKKITLYKCYTTSRRMSFPGIPSIEISAVYCFRGAHLSFDELLFNSVLLKVSSLNEWVDIGGFKDFVNSDEELSVKYINPEPITFYEADHVKFDLVFYRTAPLYRPTHNFSITQDTYILVKHDTTFDLDEFWKYAAMIKSFLTLAYFSEPMIEEIKFKQNKKTIECNYAGQARQTVKEKAHKRNFLFAYEAIKTDFRQVFMKWAELNRAIEPVINILQESFGNRNIISENKFLNLMQGIETFHRRRRQNEKEPPKIHKSKIAEVLKACPAQYQDWLKDRLHFSNEPTLQERLEQLFDELGEPLRKHLFPDAERMILQAKHTRNYLTHYDHSLKKKALEGQPLYYLTERLKILLLIILLKEAALNDEKVNEIVIEGSHFLFNHLIAEAE